MCAAKDVKLTDAAKEIAAKDAVNAALTQTLAVKDAAIMALERERGSLTTRLSDAAKEIALLKGPLVVAPFVPRVVGKDDGTYPWDRATNMCRLDLTIGEGKAVAEMFSRG